MTDHSTDVTSISENNGIRFLDGSCRKIYSVGISTGGVAEMRMAREDTKRHITATTIDLKGVAYAKQRIHEQGLAEQIDVKVEDVAKPLPYKQGAFDYVYARLVLHYLEKEALLRALKELYRILRVGGRIFVVVRSTKCPEAQDKQAMYDATSCMTTYTSGGHAYSRYFHTERSIQEALILAGFSIEHTSAYDEQLCVDFERTQKARHIDHLIEVLAIK